MSTIDWPYWAHLGLGKHNSRVMLGFISTPHIAYSGTKTEEIVTKWDMVLWQMATVQEKIEIHDGS